MKRLRALALAAVLLLVVGLVVSLAMGLRPGGDGDRASTPESVPDVPAARAAPGERVRVEVLNAAGVPGLARTVTRTLRERGFDVVYFGNARGFSPDTTLVIDRVGREEVARDVADALEVENVRSRPDSTLLLEVTVVVGRDWRGARESVGAADSTTAPVGDEES
ncbi:MAG TPA: LytR C-terminal domain-containing protein [Longimicrobiaceae bacterium]|nr:LytR C-terminal domain-containing protein [Longimicrobiaceae bacterium]